MQEQGLDGRAVIEILTGVIAFAGFVVTLMIKGTQASVKEELVKSQNDMRQDMDEKHAENSRNIATHAASDEAKFDSISRTLGRIDNKLDRMNGHPH